MRTRLMILAGCTALSWPALAQEVPSEPPPDDDYEELTEPEAMIVVRAPFITDVTILTGTSTLSGTELLNSVRPQIGETLTRLPGVSATSFSPGASRPVLRGFSGVRVRVLTDGIGSIDVSNTSVDHAVTIDPLTAERIQVLRGPAALLFGSQAVGGAVNIIDRRIPREVPNHTIHIDALATAGSASDEYSFGGAVDIDLGGGFVAHFDGTLRDTDDLEIGGPLVSDPLRADLLADAAEEREEGHLDEAAELEEFAAARGIVPNSYTRTYTGSAGVAFIRNGNTLGASGSYYNTEYGVPGRPGAGHGHEEEGGGGEEEEEGEVPVSIALEQFRFDARADVQVSGEAIDAVRFRFGYADYTHTEFEGEEVGTVFDTQGVEARLELQTVDWGGFSGAFGGQLYIRDFLAEGAEAFLPPNSTEQYGFFSFGEYSSGDMTFEAALRAEFSGIDADTIGFNQDFTAISGAVGMLYDLPGNISIGGSLSRSERAPSAEELYSNGPHIATQAFEIGDPTLSTEKSIGLEGYVRGRLGPATFSVTGYANWFSDYIYETATGAEEDGLPVFQYFQQGARYYGFEVEVAASLTTVGAFNIRGDLVADYVNATLNDDTPVSRIPPFRVLTGIEAVSDSLTGRIEAEFTARQNRVASFETPTDGFTLVNAQLTWRPWGRDDPTAVIASVNNIFDATARRHASFTKDFVPLSGRDFRISLRARF